MRVLAIDDHTLLLKGIQSLLRELDSTVECLIARTLHDGLLIAVEREVDLILLDLQLPGTTGLQTLVVAKQECPEIPVVVVSANNDRNVILEAIELGAAGYITKELDMFELQTALPLVLKRGIYLPPQIFRSDKVKVGNRESPTFSNRQLQTLQRILQGKSNKVIARELGIAEGTVKAHLFEVYQRLQANSRLSAMVRVHELGLEDQMSWRTVEPNRHKSMTL
jgi:DNA-binding NarL/FixJ family response regulator